MAAMSVSCASCHKTPAQKEAQFPRCGRCKSVFYCGIECQKANWLDHKKVCTVFNETILQRQMGLGNIYGAGCQACTITRMSGPASQSTVIEGLKQLANVSGSEADQWRVAVHLLHQRAWHEFRLKSPDEQAMGVGQLGADIIQLVNTIPSSLSGFELVNFVYDLGNTLWSILEDYKGAVHCCFNVLPPEEIDLLPPFKQVMIAVQTLLFYDSEMKTKRCPPEVKERVVFFARLLMKEQKPPIPNITPGLPPQNRLFEFVAQKQKGDIQKIVDKWLHKP